MFGPNYYCQHFQDSGEALISFVILQMRSLCLTLDTEDVLEENTFEMFLDVSLSTLFEYDS